MTWWTPRSTPLRRQLVELDGLDEQRRQITVLFADVSGFTAMSASLDAEDLAGLMNDLWRRLDGEVTRFGGRVDKHMGDAVMALWGTEHAHEDDVERAVRAGIALLEALAGIPRRDGSDAVDARRDQHRSRPRRRGRNNERAHRDG